MIHVSDISAEKRINHPQDVLKVGQLVKAQVLSVDTAKRLLRLGMKQLVPTSLDEYIAEHSDRRHGHRTHGRGFRRPGPRGTRRRHQRDLPDCPWRSSEGIGGSACSVLGEARFIIAEFEAQGALEGWPPFSRGEARGRPRRTDSQVQDYPAGCGRQKN